MYLFCSARLSPGPGLQVLIIAAALALLSEPAQAGAEAGITAFKAGNYEEAFEELKPAAEEGDASAQFYLGRLYTYGKEVAKDPSIAFQWYSKAAKGGLTKAQATVGYAFDEGIGVRINDFKAAEWYRKAATDDHVVAQRNLGLMYLDGEGVQHNNKKALHWFRRAAKQGDPVAQTRLGQEYWLGFGVAVDEGKALQWLRRAAEQDHAEAQYLLCSKYTDIYRQHSPELAKGMMWCKLAADQNYPGGEQMWEDATRWFITDEQKRKAARLAEQWRAEHQ